MQEPRPGGIRAQVIGYLEPAFRTGRPARRPGAALEASYLAPGSRQARSMSRVAAGYTIRCRNGLIAAI